MTSIRPRDLKRAMDKIIPDDVRCMHGASVIPIPTPEGLMFALRVVSHGNPGPETKPGDYVSAESVTTTDYGLGFSTFMELAESVDNSLKVYNDSHPGPN